MDLGKGKEDNLLSLGFDKEVARVKVGLCPLCGMPVKLEDFKDERSRREYNLSGLCQACQDKIFAE